MPLLLALLLAVSAKDKPLLVFRGNVALVDDVYRGVLDLPKGSKASPELAHTVVNLAELRLTEGEFAGAEPLLRRALTIHEKALGPYHPTVGHTLDLQGKRDRSSHKASTLLVAGIALGILFNPVTGPETRKWLKDMLSGGSDEFGGDYPSSNGGGTT